MAIKINREKKPAYTERVSRVYNLGKMSIISLLDMTTIADDPKLEYAADISDEVFDKVSADNFVATKDLQAYMTPTLIDTGNARVLVDTGLGFGGLMKSLKQANIDASSIDVVAITHMHPDHIGGLMTDGKPNFPNARYVVGSKEYNFWRKTEKGNIVGDLVANKLTPLAEKTTFIEDGGTITKGITAMASYGHSPGHFCFRVESEGQQIVLTADLANHYIWSFARPDWAFKFDFDTKEAAISRRRVLDMLATDKIPMIGYHMPFPGIGYVETRNKGFRFVPASYQLHKR
ncbi:MBL fold metallo-hydrolase [Aquimarina algiphila]|uniref:MBL fold metallo-hydrolase n=1 Tax=Aquimarina algiphila TaxID=2047982 RepID=UPI00248FC640|nr:MBL fold metallo-hydrolase [Aquimarina algiphila]